MYRCRFNNLANDNQYQELIKVFLKPSQYEIAGEGESLQGEYREFTFDGDKNLLKRQIYDDLRGYTGYSPKWGILTGIRPVKMARELSAAVGIDETKSILEKDYYISPQKIELIINVLRKQQDEIGDADPRSVSMYLGIPFCPTRCLYCSFTSNKAESTAIEAYLKELYREIQYVSDALAQSGRYIESLYIGGGTPTTLNEQQLEALLKTIMSSFDLQRCREFTVEAGRADTITAAKLEVLNSMKVDRISINPQSMNQRTLETIGRSHTVEDVVAAFELANKSGISHINSDLIAGLPGECPEDFTGSLNEIISLGADNITLHTLAVKRGSRLKELNEEYNYSNQQLCENMLSAAGECLRSSGYEPYYLYRQKHTSGNTENVGFSREGASSVYNVRIMDEAQTIIALGAGGISKRYYPEENRLERVANVSNYEIYIERIQEMIERKQMGLFS